MGKTYPGIIMIGAERSSETWSKTEGIIFEKDVFIGVEHNIKEKNEEITKEHSHLI